MDKKPNIFIVGPSGSGKSTCLRNLHPNSTVILNAEGKTLPFKNTRMVKDKTDPTKEIQTYKLFSTEFDNTDVKAYNNFLASYEKFLANEKVKVLVIDSFTSVCEMIMRLSKSMYEGYEIFNYYNDQIGSILNQSKASGKYVVFTGIDMTVDGANGVEERCVNVQGKVWHKKVEKEFTIVLFTNCADSGNNTEYQFVTNRKNNTTAKSPMDMLPIHMPNDLAEVIKKCDDFYGFTDKVFPDVATAPAQ